MGINQFNSFMIYIYALIGISTTIFLLEYFKLLYVYELTQARTIIIHKNPNLLNIISTLFLSGLLILMFLIFLSWTSHDLSDSDFTVIISGHMLAYHSSGGRLTKFMDYFVGMSLKNDSHVNCFIDTFDASQFSLNYLYGMLSIFKNEKVKANLRNVHESNFKIARR